MFLAHLNCIRAYAGYTYATSPETIFDTDEFTEHEFLKLAEAQSGNLTLAMNWYVHSYLAKESSSNILQVQFDEGGTIGVPASNV